MTNKIIFLFFTLTIFVGCKKDEKDPQPTIAPPTTTAEFYFAANINGKTELLQHRPGDYSNGTGNGSASGNAAKEYSTIYVKILSIGPNGTVSANKQGGVIFNLNDTPFSDEAFTKHFSIGSKSYYDGSNSEGIEVYWVDEDKKQWSSEYGVQSGSSFSLTAFRENTSSTAITAPYVVEGNFSCTLYDKEGNSIPATDGKFVGIISRY